jgi:hypothetical protein
MKVPSGVLQLVYKLALSNVGKVAEAPLEKIPHINVIAKAYDDGEPLEVIVGLYLQATASVKDDDIAAKVGEVLEFIDKKVPEVLSQISEKSFKEVLGTLLGAGNEVKVIDVINKIMKELED